MTHSPLRTLALSVAGAAMLAAPGRADWTAFGGNPEHHFYTSEKLSAPLGVLWKHATNTYAEKTGNRGGAVAAGNLVFFPSKNRLYCVDAGTGELEWRAPEADANDPNIPHITATPAIGEAMVYTPGADGTITAYNIEDGTTAWTFRAGSSPIRSSPILVGNVLYFGSDDDFVYAIDATSGDLVWKSQDRGKEFRLTDDAVGSPVYYSGVIYINSADMKLWAFQADSGKLIWMQRMTAPSIDISPVAYNQRIYMAAGATIYQFRLRGGNYRAFPLQQWVENDISTTPIITEKYWFFGDRNGYFHAFTNVGKPVLNGAGEPWKVKLEGKPIGSPIMTQDTIFVSTDKGFVYAIDLTKGRIGWTYRTEAPKGIEPLFSYYPIRAPLAVSDGRLFVVGDDGTLTCMTPDAPDDEGPIITTPKPSRGTVTNGSPPLYISAYLWDEGTGINPDTIELLVDGVPVDPDEKAYNERVVGQRKGWIYDPVRRLLTYSTPKGEEGKPDQPLLNGRHRVQLQAADWRGNFESLEWTFVVDNSLPRGAIAVKPKAAPKTGAPGMPGGYPGGPGGYPGGSEGAEGYAGPGAPGGYPGMPGGPGMAGPQSGFRNRFGGYQYQNRGRGGYRGGFGGPQGGFGQRGGFGGPQGGFGNRRGGFGF